ncbi:hypothetical protein CPB85DRAFT_1495552, partial [Mucidula mucida]
DVLNGLTLPALVDFRIAQELRPGTCWPTHPTLNFLSRSGCKLVSYHVELQRLSRPSAVVNFDTVRWRALLRMQSSLVRLRVHDSRFNSTTVASNQDLRVLTEPVCPALQDISLSVAHSQLPIIQEILALRCGGWERGVVKLEACNLDLHGYVSAPHLGNLLAYFQARQFPVSVTQDGRPMRA